jgi:hypothetical protein
LKGFSFKHLHLGLKRYLLALLTIVQEYYPETVDKFVIVNAPRAFSAAWGMIKAFLPLESVKKVSILGSSFESELFQLVSPESLPLWLKGKNVDDPLLRTDIQFEEHSVELMSFDTNSINIVLRRNDRISWEISSENGNVELSVVFCPVSRLPLVVLDPIQRCCFKDAFYASDEGELVFKLKRTRVGLFKLRIKTLFIKETSGAKV